MLGRSITPSGVPTNDLALINDRKICQVLFKCTRNRYVPYNLVMVEREVFGTGNSNGKNVESVHLQDGIPFPRFGLLPYAYQYNLIEKEPNLIKYLGWNPSETKHFKRKLAKQGGSDFVLSKRLVRKIQNPSLSHMDSRMGDRNYPDFSGVKELYRTGVTLRQEVNENLITFINQWAKKETRGANLFLQEGDLPPELVGHRVRTGGDDTVRVRRGNAEGSYAHGAEEQRNNPTPGDRFLDKSAVGNEDDEYSERKQKGTEQLAAILEPGGNAEVGPAEKKAGSVYDAGDSSISIYESDDFRRFVKASEMEFKVPVKMGLVRFSPVKRGARPSASNVSNLCRSSNMSRRTPAFVNCRSMNPRACLK